MAYVASIGTYVPSRVGVGPMAEVHDFFTGNELIGYEDLGFAEGLRGYELVEAEVAIIGRGPGTVHGSAWRTILFRRRCRQ